MINKEKFTLNREEREELLKYIPEDNKKLVNDCFGRKEYMNDEEKAKYKKILEQTLIDLCYKLTYPEFSDNIKNGKKIAFFGAGHMANYLINEKKYFAEIILDNNPDKESKKVGGINVVSTKNFNKWDKYIILITVTDSKQIEQQLTSKGLIKGKDFFDASFWGIK
jgi:hypothetical protein